MNHALTFHTCSPTDATTWRMLCLRAADGVVGWGEFTLKANGAVVAARTNHLVDRLGAAPDEATLRAATRTLQTEDQLGAALGSAVDVALADIASRRAGVPLAAWLGAPSPASPVTLYANINRGTRDRTPDGFAARGHQALAEGHRAIKVAPFDDMAPAIAHTPEGRILIDRGIARVQALADAVGDRATVMVDCHWRFDEAAALGVLPALADAGIGWFECPIPESADGLDALRRIRSVANDLGVRTAGCETMTGWADFAPFVEGGAYDVVMPDIKYAGGVSGLADFCARCRPHDVAVSLHNPSGPIAHAASLHATAALCPGERLEFPFAETPRFDELVNGALPDRSEGVSDLPGAAGIGVAPDLDLMDRQPPEDRTCD